VILQHIVELAALLAALQVQRSRSPLSQLQQSSERHLLFLVLLLVVTEGVVLSSVTHCVIPMAHMVAVARKQNLIMPPTLKLTHSPDLTDTAATLMATAWSPMGVSLAARARPQRALFQRLRLCRQSLHLGLTQRLLRVRLVSP